MKAIRNAGRRAPVDQVDAQIAAAQARLDAHCALMCELPADQREGAVTRLVVLTDAVIALRFGRSEIIRNFFYGSGR